MTQTMSNPNEWAQFYRQINFSGQSSPPIDIPVAPDHHQVPLDTTTSLGATSGSSLVNGSGSSVGGLNTGGRVAKPKRRRSRASRRTPTTLLSTDTANFRAMVQQFTGGPGAHFLATSVGTTSIRPAGGAMSINFGIDPGRADHVPVPVMLHGAGQHHQGLLQQHHDAPGQRQAFDHIPQDQGFMNMLSLDHRGSNAAPGQHHQFPPRPPFM